MLADVVVTRDALDVEGAYVAMRQAVRNLGRAGIASMAISAVDTALWDLKARLLDLPLVGLLGGVRDCGSRLRQRRLHLVFALRGSASSSRGGFGMASAREDENRP